MLKRHVFGVLLCFTSSSLFGQRPLGQSASIEAEALQRKLAQLIQSGAPNDMAQAIATLKEEYAKNDKGTEAVFKDLRNLRANMMADKAHAGEMLVLIELGKKAKRDKNNVGYLYAMEVIVRFQLGQEQEALDALQRGLAKDRFKNTAGEITKFWPMVYKESGEGVAAIGKKEEFARVLRAIILGCWDQDTVEAALKQRIALLNATGKPDEALLDAKLLFNIATMPHTAAAIQALDKQLGLVDPARQAAFRKEQTDGVAEGKTSPTVLAIKVEGLDIKPILEREQGTGTGVTGAGYPSEELLHRGMLMLMAENAEEVRKAAQRVIDIHESETISLAGDMMARSLKIEDGTVGRANAWLKSNPLPKGTPRLKIGEGAQQSLP